MQGYGVELYVVFSCIFKLCTNLPMSMNIMYYALYDCNFKLLAQTMMYIRNVGKKPKGDHIYYVLFVCNLVPNVL